MCIKTVSHHIYFSNKKHLDFNPIRISSLVPIPQSLFPCYYLPMKLISWNVNGLRAAIKKGFLDWLHRQDADIVGLQEIKAEVSQLENDVLYPEGAQGKWHAYFSSSRTKKGYSGVALFCKNVPDKVDYGMGESRFDDEGRYIAVHFKDTVVINCYFPNGGGGPERLSYKLDFYDSFLSHIEEYKRQGKKIIFMGDVNTAHNEIDLARPKQNEKNTGFLQIERDWLDEVVRSGYTDTFRNLYPTREDSYSYWDMKTAARERNVGWRIDYFFISNNLLNNLSEATIEDNVYGSDHCPITLTLKDI